MVFFLVQIDVLLHVRHTQEYDSHTHALTSKVHFLTDGCFRQRTALGNASFWICLLTARGQGPQMEA